jgi:hypothetical protein
MRVRRQAPISRRDVRRLRLVALEEVNLVRADDGQFKTGELGSPGRWAGFRHGWVVPLARPAHFLGPDGIPGMAACIRAGSVVIQEVSAR